MTAPACFVTQTCTKCGRTKPVAEFSTGNKGRPRTACKAYREDSAGLVKRRYQKDSPGQVRTAETISPKEAAAIFQEITGRHISAGFIRTQADNFPQLADWTVTKTGETKFSGIIPSRWRWYVQTRLIMRGKKTTEIFNANEV